MRENEADGRQVSEIEFLDDRLEIVSIGPQAVQPDYSASRVSAGFDFDGRQQGTGVCRKVFTVGHGRPLELGYGLYCNQAAVFRTGRRKRYNKIDHDLCILSGVQS